MIRRILIALSWLAFAAALVLALMGAIMLINGVSDARGGAIVLTLVAVVLGGLGAGLRYVSGRP